MSKSHVVSLKRERCDRAKTKIECDAWVPSYLIEVLSCYLDRVNIEIESENLYHRKFPDVQPIRFSSLPFSLR